MISKQAIHKYLKRRQDELAAIEDLLIQGNFAEASLLFHKVKGSASTFGFDLLGDIAAALEEECLKQPSTPVSVSQNSGTANAEALHLFGSYRDNLLDLISRIEPES